MAEQEAASGVSLTTFARALGMDLGQVSRLVKAGKIPTLADKTIDMVAGSAALQMNHALLRQSGSEYRDALTMRTKLQSAKLQKELQELSGSLVSREEVLLLWQETAIQLKTRLRLIPSRMALQLASEDKPPVIQQKLQEAIDQALTIAAERLDEFFRQQWGSREKEKAKKQKRRC